MDAYGSPAIVANAYLEGIYSKLYPNITPDELGMQKLFKQFSFPGGIPSHVAPEIPGSMPFDMVVLNGLDRYHLVMVAIDQLSGWGGRATYMKQMFQYKLIEHRHYVETYGQDMLEVSEWQWSPTQEQ